MSGMLNHSLSAHANELAKIMHEISHWSKTHPNAKKYSRALIKLPPVFLTSSNKHGNGLNNLVAIIKTICAYEEGLDNGEYPRLVDLPAIYNGYGGLPALTEKDYRKVHNWVQQVVFGIRVACTRTQNAQPLFNDWNSLPVPERVFRRLYAYNPKRPFITCSMDNKNNYKPLKYADDAVKRKWIEQEYVQKKNKKMHASYGAKPTYQEWRDYGLSGQVGRQVKNQIQKQIGELLILAEEYDKAGEYEKAESITSKIHKMNQDLATLNSQEQS